MTGLRHHGPTTEWTLLRDGALFAEMSLPMAGEHNALNATAAAALAAGQGIETGAIVEALASFRSVKRRLEVRAEVNGVTIIDDFAHHPTAIRETLRALREGYAGRRIWAVLEPRSNTLRRNVFEGALVDSLSLADRVVLASVFKSESIPLAERLQPERLAARLVEAGTPAVSVSDADAVVTELLPAVEGGGRGGHSFEWRFRKHLREAAARACGCRSRGGQALIRTMRHHTESPCLQP